MAPGTDRYPTAASCKPIDCSEVGRHDYISHAVGSVACLKAFFALIYTYMSVRICLCVFAARAVHVCVRLVISSYGFAFSAIVHIVCPRGLGSQLASRPVRGFAFPSRSFGGTWSPTCGCLQGLRSLWERPLSPLAVGPPWLRGSAPHFFGSSGGGSFVRSRSPGRG